MRKLFIALLIVLSSFTDTNISYSFPTISNPVTKEANTMLTALNTSSISNEYLTENYNITTNNFPTSLPIDTLGLKRISEYFCVRNNHPILKKRVKHKGIDFSGKLNTPIYSAANGTVKEVRRSLSYGKLLVIDHGNGLESYYGHLNKILVKEGDTVASGQEIAKLGNSGWSTGPHLHFEIKANGTSIDPTSLLKCKGSTDEAEIIKLMLNQKTFRNVTN